MITKLKTYYLLTPAFAFLHYTFDINIRLHTPWDSWQMSGLYYFICSAAPLVLFRTKLTTSLFCLGECSFNILLLLLTIFLPLLHAGDNLANSQMIGFEFGIEKFIQFAISSIMLAIAFHQNIRELQAS